MRRSQSRVLMVSKLQIEKKMEKLKKRMNALYIEFMAHQDALNFFNKQTPEEAQQAIGKEEQLRNEVIEQIEEQTNKNLPEIHIEAQLPEVLEQVKNDTTLGEVK